MANFKNPWPTTCPRCGKESSLNLLAGPFRGGRTKEGYWEYAALYQCPTCRGFALLVLDLTANNTDAKVQGQEVLPFATAKTLDGVPPPASQDRDEAWSAFHGGLDKGAALLARSSLESAANSLKAKGKDLKAKIADLADEGRITKDLATWATEVRVTGNEAAHEMGQVSAEDARDGLYFLDAFLEAVFVVPHRHEQRRRRRQALSEEGPDGPAQSPEG